MCIRDRLRIVCEHMQQDGAYTTFAAQRKRRNTHKRGENKTGQSLKRYTVFRGGKQCGPGGQLIGTSWPPIRKLSISWPLSQRAHDCSMDSLRRGLSLRYGFFRPSDRPHLFFQEGGSSRMNWRVSTLDGSRLLQK